MDASGCRRPVTPRERAEARRTVRGISLVLGMAALHLLAFFALSYRYDPATAACVLPVLLLAEGLYAVRDYSPGSRRTLLGTFAVPLGLLALGALVVLATGWMASVEYPAAGVPALLSWPVGPFREAAPETFSLLELAAGLAALALGSVLAAWTAAGLVREASSLARRAFLAPVSEDPAPE